MMRTIVFFFFFFFSSRRRHTRFKWDWSSDVCSSDLSLTFTDIHSTWTETRAVMGKSQAFVQEALEDIRNKLPFPMRGIDSDNGSEFITHHLMAYCKAKQIEFTRSRPYKKDDNAHVEQKNWT